MTQELLKLALEALDHLITEFRNHDLPYGSKAYTKGTNAIRKIQADLAQPQQEPHFSVQQAYAMAQVCLDLHEALGCKWGDNPYLAIADLREAQPQQEPLEYWNAVEGWVKINEVREHFDSVGCGTIYKTAGEDRVPVYTSPPQRKPLTESFIMDSTRELSMDVRWPSSFIDVWRLCEAAHGIKENT